jgi:hypothetical protein
MEDDKADYRKNPVRTHLEVAPSEERGLPERRQVSLDYAARGALSNYWQLSSKGQTASTRY